MAGRTESKTHAFFVALRRKVSVKGLLMATLTSVSTIVVLTISSLWTLSVIGTDSARTTITGTLQIPVQFYKHPETEKEIIMVGVVHVGSPEYYRDLQVLIDGAEHRGFTILYEGIGGDLTPKDLEKLSLSQRKIDSQLNTTFEAQQAIVVPIADKAVHQNQGLLYSQSWIRTDIDHSRLLQLFDEAGAELLPGNSEDREKAISLITKHADHPVVQTLILYTMKMLPGIWTLDSWLGSLRKNSDLHKAHHIILTVRNEIAVRNILHYVKDTSVVSIWGAMHLPGIHKELVSAGFIHMDTQWYDAL